MPLASDSQRLRWLALTVGTVVVSVLVFAVFHSALTRWNLALQDWVLRQTTTNLPEDFVLIGIDEPSITLSGLDPEEIEESRALQLMKEGFPWSREVYAELITRLMEAGARLVILDLVFPAPRIGDEELAAVMKKFPGRVVIGCNFDLSDKGEGRSTADFYPPTSVLAEAAQGNMGFVNFSSLSTLETDSITRYFLLHGTGDSFRGKIPDEADTILPAMMTTAARLLGREEPMDVFPRRMRYSVPGSMPMVPLYQVFLKATWERNFKSRDFFKDKVVLLGATAEQQKDFLITPFGRMAGPEVQMHALAALLRNDWIKHAGTLAMLLSIPLAGVLAFGLAGWIRNVVWFMLVVLAGVVLWLGVCVVVFLEASYFLPIIPPLFTWLVSGFAVLACDVSLERRERGRQRRILERYMSQDVVREMLDNPGSYLESLGGQRKVVVTLFSDLKGFTADSEKLDPVTMVSLLNEYFGEMVAVIFSHRGIHDKFMGDAIMATWGGLRTDGLEKDAQNAVKAAFEMRRQLHAMNVRRADRSVGWDSGIGISQGSVLFGNIGSKDKMDITVIGDAVNLASRIEGLTRVYGCSILVDEDVAQNISEICEVLLVDEVRVKGRQRPEKLYFPYQEKDEAWVEAFSTARSLYVKGEFVTAGKRFRELSQGGLVPRLADSYARRCGLLAQEPPEDWSGIWTFMEK